MKYLTKEKRYDLIDAFNSTSRYLDDLISIDNINLEQIVHRTYAPELQLKREPICLLLFSCNYVVSVRRGFLILWVLGMGCDILLWHSLCLPYNHLAKLMLLIPKQPF